MLTAPMDAARVAALEPSHSSHLSVSEFMRYSGQLHAPQNVPLCPSAQGRLALSVNRSIPGV